ncbi:hypothetical protein QE152_g11324 [Popillia japonica]|uniref:Uncharacterized protein n=1 Tax=Popillia japonica TaxID=7064 RepID=A0AAW1LRY9_POPJA
MITPPFLPLWRISLALRCECANLTEPPSAPRTGPDAASVESRCLALRCECANLTEPPSAPRTGPDAASVESSRHSRDAKIDIGVGHPCHNLVLVFLADILVMPKSIQKGMGTLETVLNKARPGLHPE